MVAISPKDSSISLEDIRNLASTQIKYKLIKADGVERVDPLGAVAIGGLVVGTLMTLIFIPVGFVWLVGESSVVEE